MKALPRDSGFDRSAFDYKGSVLLFLSGALTVILVLMHSGKGTGVSDMIASSLYNSSAATGIMEQNLDKLTVIVAVVFAVCVVLAMFFFPQGIVGI